MKTTKIYQGKKARQILKKGVDELGNAVAATIGPRGRNAAIDTDFGSPIMSNDGDTISININLEDRAKNIGCRALIQASERVNSKGGDGTTTTVVLAKDIINRSFKKIDALFLREDPIIIKKDMEHAFIHVDKYLLDHSRSIKSDKEIEDIATISAESRELGKLIADTIKQIGRDGAITVETSPFSETTTELSEGFQFFRGYMSPYMITDIGSMEAVLDNPYIMIIDKKINEFQDIMPALKASLDKLCKNILIIAPDASLEALATTLANNNKGTTKIVIVKSPSLGANKDAILQDIAVLTGGKVLSENNGIYLSSINDTSNFGIARKVIITKDSTTIIGGKGSKESVQKRIEELNAEYNSDKNMTVNLAGVELKQRIGKLSGKVAIIKVGGATELEQTAIKLKIDDAVCATKAAIEDGVIEGGGVALLNCSKYLKSLKLNTVGSKILEKALEAPIRMICKNAGINPDWVLKNLEKSKEHTGFNALTFEYIDFFEEGIIDPVKVTRLAIESAISVSGILLTTEVLVVNNKDNNEQQ